MEESNVQRVEEAPMSEDSQDESEIETPRVDEERDMDTSEAEEESPVDEHVETPAVMPVEVLSEESEDEHRGKEVEQAMVELSESEGEDVDSEVAGSAAEAVDAEVSGSEAEAVDSEVAEAEAADSESSEAEEAEAASFEVHEVDEETAETTEDEGEKEEEAPSADVHEPLSQEMELTALHEPEAEFEEEEPSSAEEEPNVLNDSLEEPFPAEEEPNVLNDSLEEPFPAEEDDSMEEPFPAEEEPNGLNDSLHIVEEYRADDEGSATDQDSASVDEEVDVEIIKEVSADEAQSASEDATASSEEENETSDAEEELTREAEDDLSFMPAPGPPGAKTVGKPSLPAPSTAMEMVEEKKAALSVTDARSAKASQNVSHPSVLVTLRPPSLPIVSDKAKQSPATVLKTPIAKVWQSPRERKPSLKVALAQQSSPAAAAAQQGRRSKVPVVATPPASAPAPPLAAHADLTPVATSSNSIFEQPPDEVLYEHCCPLQKCRKIFRRPHLLQMHIKHYHPEYEHLLSVTSVIAMAQNRTDGVDAPSVASPMVKQTAGVSSPLPVDDSKTLKETIAELEARKALESEEQPEAFAEPEVEAMPSPAIKQDNSLTPTVTDHSGRKKKKKKSRLTGSRRSKKRTSAASAAVVATPEVAFVEPEVPMEVVEDAVPEEEVPPAVEEVSQPEVEEPPAAMPAPPPIVPMVLRTNKKKGAGFWAVQQEDQRQKSSTSAPLAITAPPPIPAITAPPPLPAITAAKQVAGAGLPTPPQSRSGGSSNHFADDVSSSDAWGEDSAVETDGGTAAEQPAAAAFDIICCSCRSTENEGLMIQCDTCLTWQHGTCEQLDETALPDKYECTTCRNPRLQRPSMKFMHDQKYLKTGVLPKPAVLEDLDAGEKESIVARKRLHELLAHIVNIQDMFPSLEHKINIARNINHPKLVQWAKPWTTSTPAAAVVQQASTSTAASAAAGTADSAPELSYDEVRRIASLLESTLLRTNPAAVAEGTSAGIAAVGEAIASVAGIAREASIGHDGAGVHAEHPHGAELALVSDLAEWIADGSAAVGPSLVDVVPPPIPVFKAPELKRIEPQECQANLIAHVEDVQKNLEDELNRMSEVLDDVEKRLNAPNLKPETRHALMNFLSKFFPKAVSHADAE